MEEISSLQNLRQHEKQKWTNLYHDLVKLVGQNHKYKGYFKEVFKKKILPKGEHNSQTRNSSSESSDSEQNIDSADDSSTVVLSEIDEGLLKKVMELRIERQSVEDAMKVLKRQINKCKAKENAARRKIQKANDAFEEYANKLNAILSSRRQSLEKIKWPLVLYPINIHSDYIINPESDVERQKKLLDTEMFRINEEIEKKLKVVNHYVNVSTFTLMSRVVNLEVNDLIDIAAVLFPLLEKVSSLTDEHFVSLRQVKSLEQFEEVSEPTEPVNIISEILATVKDPVVVSEVAESEIEPQINSSTSDDKVDGTGSKSTLIVSEKSLSVISLSDFKADESDQSRYKKLISWRELVDDGNDFEPADSQLPEQVNSEEFVKSAIPEIDYSSLIVKDYSKEMDYYMLPFTSTVADNDLEKLKKRIYVSSTENELESCKSYDQVDSQDNVLDEASESDYPVYPGGGLKLTLPVLQGMEANDRDHFPYTDFVPKEEFEEELDYHHTALDLKPQRSLESESLFNYTTRPLSEFILVGTEDVQRTLTSYFDIKTSNEEIEMNLGLLKKEVMSTKRALNFKQHDVSKAKQELEMTMKTRFGQVLDLDQLQDALENPHFHIKKKEHHSQLDILKRKLKRMKEAEAVAVKSLDQLRYEDTKLCYELYELRKELEFLNKCHSSKRKVLPKIGEISKYENT